MSTSRPAASASAPAAEPAEKSFFELQRDQLVSEIALSLEHVLMNMNVLNRSLEGVIAVGKEFESVEALWSQFENVMAKNPEETKGAEEGEGDESTVMYEGLPRGVGKR
ncbi:DASH complex subunit Dad1 [Morchella conica CCBAS932]|uniref:DASH complex subunit DAD1 n=1 Tax=Morchella conica CCBAS932 TaxID=1392247 RepID=A0A3N4KEC1_9PEZI|nr:DASH complex subunit Dad1 [Morchella conica CCBAS932]